MPYDPAVAARMLTNSRWRRALGGCAYRDLGGALALTTDSPIPDLNCLGDFTSDERHIDGVLDIGFALLRAFDCDPAVRLTSLDRPRSLAKRLRQRRLAPVGGESWMLFDADAARVETSRDVEVRVIDPEQARVFAAIHGGRERWVRKLSLATILAGSLAGGNTFYLGCDDGAPVATLHLLQDGGTAGIYAVGTQRAHRRKGIASALITRAVRDAHAAGCDIVFLSTVAGGNAERLYERLAFKRVFESEMWVAGYT